ncbi:MAG: CHAD domain-containing protein [Solirubrobacterales bacterium]|nr:CHAD domain-containing protein [Solirubrobacterales bacterium]
MAYKLPADENVRDAVVRAAREQLDRAVRNLSDTIGDDPVGAVHAARKAVKKERSLLRLTRGALPAKLRRRENAALRTAAAGLSDARDAEVMLETLDELAERFAGQLPRSVFDEVREPLERERDATRSRLADSALGPRTTRELAAVRDRIGGWKLRRDGWGALEKGVQRNYRRGRRAMAAARREPTLEAMHAWRKRVKDLWYQQRLLAPSCGPTTRGHARDLHRLSDVLGDDHDLGVLRARLTDLHVGTDVDALIALLDHRQAELRGEAWALGDRVYAEKPATFAKRMRRSWAAGRALAVAQEPTAPVELAEATRTGPTA